jgi:hypothetical protein
MAHRRPDPLYATLADPTAAASASASCAFDATGTHFDTVVIEDPLPKSMTTAT